MGGTHTTPYTEGFVSAGLPLPWAGMLGWGGCEGEGRKKGHKHTSLRDSRAGNLNPKPARRDSSVASLPESSSPRGLENGIPLVLVLFLMTVGCVTGSLSDQVIWESFFLFFPPSPRILGDSSLTELFPIGKYPGKNPLSFPSSSENFSMPHATV